MTPSLSPSPITAAIQALAPYQQYICDACGYLYDEATGDY